MNLQRTTAVLIASAAVSAVLATGCSSHSSASNSNSGGDTTCKDFLAANKDGRNAIITQYLKQTGQSSDSKNVSSTRVSAEAFCHTTGKNKLVKNITTG